MAEQKNRKALEVVRSDIAKAQSQLRALDKQHTDLDALVARAKNATIVNTDDKVSKNARQRSCQLLHSSFSPLTHLRLTLY